MGIKEESGCSKIKRRKMVINRKQLLPSSSGDGDRPTELLVTSKRKSKGSGSGSVAQDNQKEDLELQMKSYDEITEYIARSKKNLLRMAKNLPDMGEKLKETLQRYEDELARRETWSSGSGGDTQENQNEDLELQTKSYDEITEYIARSKRVLLTIAKKLPDKGEKLKETLQRYEDELERRNKLQSEKVLPVAKREVIENLHLHRCLPKLSTKC